MGYPVSFTKNKWRNQFTVIESASKFHNHVRDFFATDPLFKNLKCWQEVNVQQLIPEYPYHNHHYDWYIEEFSMVIELHGMQHYKLTNYGNIGYRQAQREFYRIKDRDNTKKQAALTAGLQYREIRYQDLSKLTPQVLKTLILGEPE